MRITLTDLAMPAASSMLTIHTEYQEGVKLTITITDQFKSLKTRETKIEDQANVVSHIFK